MSGEEDTAVGDVSGEEDTMIGCIKLEVRTPEIPYLSRQLSDCLSDKSTKGVPGSRIKEGEISEPRA